MVAVQNCFAQLGAVASLVPSSRLDVGVVHISILEVCASSACMTLHQRISWFREKLEEVISHTSK